MSKYSKEPSFKSTGLDQIVNEVCLALSAYKDGKYRPSGTAVLIANGLAITAKHVVEEFLRDYDKIKMEPGKSYDGTFNLLGFNISAKGNKGIIFNVTRFWISPITDIAFLNLEVMRSSKEAKLPPSAQIDFTIPELGDRVTGFGYPSPSIEIDDEEIIWKTDPSTTVGEVIEVYPQIRDEVMINFPCFRTNARFDPSMSGGPVFNDSGHVCGLICSSMPSEDDEHVSYVTALWPIVNLEIDAERPDMPKGSKYRINDLIDKGFLKAKGTERIILETDSSGKTENFGYQY